MENTIETLPSKISNRSATAAVIGLGDVGLPLAVEIAKAGFQTIGFDIAEEKVSSINRGKNYIKDVKNADLSELVGTKKLRASSNFAILQECDFISICVPTPLGKGKNPDMSFILSAVTGVKNTLRRGYHVQSFGD